MKSLLIGVWDFFDPYYFNCTRLTHLDMLTENQNNILRVRLTRYQGREVVLSDGTEIKKNDILVKIHLHNVRILKEITPIVNDVRRARVIYQSVKSSLPGLISYIQNQPESEKIKGIIGITSLKNRAANRLGFEIVPISNPLYRAFKWLSSFPIYLLSTSSWSTVNNSKHHAPCYLFMSKPTLFNRYRIKV